MNLENYETLPNGVIKQININKITYDYNYSDKYNQYGEKGKYLSYLRYGVLLGVSVCILVVLKILYVRTQQLVDYPIFFQQYLKN